PDYLLQRKGFSEMVEPECRLLANPLFWWLTSVCNLVIACGLSSMIYFVTSNPLITIGDVADSFIAKPSELTARAACTYDYTAFKNTCRPRLVPRPYYGWPAVSLTKWALGTFLFSSVVVTLIISYFAGLSSLPYLKPPSIGKLFSAGLGESLDNSSGSLTTPVMGSVMTELQLVAVANTPQFITSLTYLYYNIVLTTMAVEREWHRPGMPGTTQSRAPTLRVSQPRGQQRSSYFLSLPYRYGIPLLILTTVEKWLASISLFYPALDVYDINGVKVKGDDDDSPSIITLGYSLSAVYLLIIITSVSWVGIVTLGILRTVPAGGKPLLGACSGVIVTACQLSAAGNVKQAAREDIAAGSLCWGAIKQVYNVGNIEQWLGFTSERDVELPVDGEVYG
ncbi:hypothetical protein V8F06_006316, partial [Rhypophila decipiens]